MNVPEVTYFKRINNEIYVTKGSNWGNLALNAKWSNFSHLC